MARRDAQLGKLSHVCSEPNQALEHGTKRGPGQSRPSNWPNNMSKHACKGVEGRAGPSRGHAAASPLSLPDKERKLLERAKALQQQLLSSPDTVQMDKVELADECCARILQAMKQPAPQMDWITAAKKPTPVVCVPCGRAGGPHHPPPPLLVDIECDLVWKPPNWPWHSVAQHWGKVAWAAYVEPHLVLGLQPVEGPGPAADGANANPELHAAPNRSLLQEGEVVGQVAAAADAPTPVAALHASPVGSLARWLDTRPVEHAGEGVHGQADQAGPGCRGGGHELNTVTPPQEPCPDPTRTATSSRGPEPAQPGPPDVHPAANLPTAQPTAASSTPFAQATAAGGSVQPGDQQEDEALPYVAPEPACTDTVYGSLLEAWELQQELLSGRRKPPRKVLIGGSHNILGLLAAPAANVDLHSRLDASMVPVICMDHVRTAASPQPPCPFLVRIRDNNIEEVLYRNPRIQWGRLLQGWQAVERIGQLTSGGQLVLGLRAASSGSAAPGPAPALLLPDPCHHQGQGAQQASSPGEAPEPVAAPPAAPAAQPFGPEPLDGLQGVPARDPSPMEEELTAEALVAAARPGADPLPNVVWGAFNAKGRCLEDLYKSFIQGLGLGGCEVGTQVTLIVALALQYCDDGSEEYGSMHVHCTAERVDKSKDRWPLRVAEGSTKRLSTWVRNKGLQLTGQYKVHRELVVAGPHLLVLEVKPLPQATTPTGQPPAGSDGSLNGAGPSQPGAVPAPAAGGAAGRGSGSKRMRTGAGTVQAEGKRKRNSKAPEPGLDAGLAEPAPAGLQQEQERGPATPPGQTGPAGMEGVAYEGDPVVPLPAAAPAHAGLSGGNGQDVADPIVLTHEGPGVEPCSVRVENSYNRTAVGTFITAQRDMSQVLVTSIVLKSNVALVDIISTRMMGQYGFLATVFEAFRVHKLSVDVVATSEVSVSLTLDPKKLPDIESELGQLKLDLDKIATVSYRRNLAIVSLICNVQRTSRILENVFDVLDSCGINVVMMSQGASKTNISLVVEGADGQKAVLALHKRFFEDSSHV